MAVSDQGCGMSTEFINNSLFKPFSTTKKKGLGIGLFQCKQIIEAHGGRIEVKSKVGVGTTFVVTLQSLASRAGVL
jgi:signal transduction histidine kinase